MKVNQLLSDFWLQFYDSNKQYLGVVQETVCQVNLHAWRAWYYSGTKTDL